MSDYRRLIDLPLVWGRTSDVRFPWKTTYDSHTLQVYDGDWPAESPYTLYVDGKPVLDLGGWPAAWVKGT